MELQKRISKIGNMLKLMGLKVSILQVQHITILVSLDKNSEYHINKMVNKLVKKLQAEDIPAYKTATRLENNCKAFIVNLTGQAIKEFSVSTVQSLLNGDNLSPVQEVRA